MTVTFGVNGGKSQAGIDSIREGSHTGEVWTPGRELNGDDDNQGGYFRIPAGEFAIRRVRLYQYR